MKKDIKKYKVPIFLILGILFVACSGDDDTGEVFAETPTERLNSKITELRSVLKSADEGWKTVYFTDDSQLGGFTFLFDFIDDDNVRMTSDFDSDTDFATSKYDVVLGSTVKLSFTTKNDIHKLSDNANPPDGDLLGVGYLGDFEFLYQGVDETTGDLIFKTNRDQKELRFTRNTSLDTEVANIVASLNMPQLLNDPSKSVYQNLTITSNGSTETFGASFNPARRFFVATGADRSIDFGVAYTSTGISISPPIEVNGKEASESIYDAATDTFIADLGDGDIVTLAYASAPPIATNDNLLVVADDNGYAYFDDFLLDAHTTSFNFRNLRDIVNSNLQAVGFRLLRVQFSFNDPENPDSIEYRISRLSDGATRRFFHYITYTTIDDRLILMDNGWDGSGIDPFVAAIDNVLTDPEGLYVKQEDFRVRFSNTIFTFTSAADPSIRMTAYAFQ